jgi:hypothetical protein
MSRLSAWSWSGRSWRRFGAGVGIALASFALTTGCGGASSPATTTHPPPTATSPTSPTTTPETTPPTQTGTAPSTGTSTVTRPSAPGTGTAAAALAHLQIKGRAPKTGYSRDEFGGGWASVAGCATRDRILQRDLTEKTYLAGSTCRVRRGTLDDPYTGTAVNYVRGGASEVDIDHVVALMDAWQKGAQQWSAARRETFANDPLELLAVSAAANRAKGDGDAATWLPPNKSFRCHYVARQIAVKRRYRLWVTQAEHDAMARVLARCPNLRLPDAGPPPPVAARPARPPRSARRTAPGSKTAGSGQGRHFANCAAVRAAGLAPLRRGTPDYQANPHLDRDKDGLACE